MKRGSNDQVLLCLTAVFFIASGRTLVTPSSIKTPQAAVLANASALVGATSNASALSAELAELGIPPGSTTTWACGKMKTLKEKFVDQLEAETKTYEANKLKWTTKLCTGLGCETDEATRMKNQAEWDTIENAHKKEKARLSGLLTKIEDIISEPPFRRCPEFEGYLKAKSDFEHGEKLLDEEEKNVKKF
mmetsp:Transcript_94381/g.149258  ORF Transcript_94381/g.149258 Transcript_94381/m.149258 type:complete len:190 (+) Transcript_94381:54-623(+)